MQKIRIFKLFTKQFFMLLLGVYLSFTAVGTIHAYASGNETVAAAEGSNQQGGSSDTAETDQGDDGSFFLILMGGILLIIIFAVVSTVTAVSGCAIVLKGNEEEF